MSLVEKIYKMLLLNECGGDESLVYKFSDADGVRTGRSGYSFGVSQFDIENNWDGILCLRDCGFRPKQLDRLFEQSTDIDDLNEKLKRNNDVVDKYDIEHIESMIVYCDSILTDIDPFTNEVDITIASLVDYHNQFNLSYNGKLHNFLIDIGYVDLESIYNFKLFNTEWGKKRPDDIKRRWENMMKVFSS